MIYNPTAIHNAAQRRVWRNRAHINNAYTSWMNSRVPRPKPPVWMYWDVEAGTNRGTMYPTGLDFTTGETNV